MFNWLGNIFPYSDLHSLNLDWILNNMKETAAQAAKAVADAANALAQVAEAKAAALSAQTAAEDAQTAANKAAGNAASAAANAVQALNAAQTAQETATAANNKAQTAQETATAANSAAQTAQNTANTAKSAAETAQNTANTAQSAAQTAQNTANTAQSAAETAQSAADNAQTAADNALSKFPVKREDIADSAVGQRQIDVNAVGTNQISDFSVTTSKIKDGAVTNKKMSGVDFYVGIGSYSKSGTTTSTQIAAGQAVFSFSRIETKTIIFVVYAGNDYNVGDTPHHLFMYSDPFIINTTATKRVVDITLEDFNKQTGENMEYKGSLTISVSTSVPSVVTCKLTFTDTLPFSNDIAIPYGISGLAARPIK